MAEHWHIIGVGAVGGWLAARFHAHRIPVLVLVGTDDSYTITLTELDGSTSEVVLPAECPDAQLPPIKRLIVATKAHQVPDALNSIRHRLDEQTRILLVQNGMGFEAVCQAAFPQVTFIRALITHGAYRKSPRHVIYAGSGEVFIGALDAKPVDQAALLAPFNTCQMNASWADAIVDHQWRKLTINAAINPLSALFNCANGELLKSPNSKRWLRLLIQETEQLLQAAGFGHLRERMQASVYDVAEQTADNFSSMHQDFNDGRPTEIDYINGHLLNLARQLGLYLPTHSKIYTYIKQGTQTPFRL